MPSIPPSALCLRFLTWLCISPGFLLPSWSRAQDVDHTIETVIDIEEGRIDPEDLPILDALRQAPLNINTADRMAWEQLPWITPDLAQAIVAWRHTHGPFSNRDMLIRVPGMDEAILDQIMPFIVAVNTVPRTHGRWRMTDSRHGRNGLPGNGRLGMASDIHIRDRLSGGMRLERRLPDRTYRWQTGYGEIHDTGIIDELILGYFEMDAGQGLVWNSRSTRPSLGSYSASVKARSRGLRPVRTTYSTRSYLGIAGQQRWPHLQFTWAVSQDKSGLTTSGGRLAWRDDRGIIGTSFMVKGHTLISGLDMDILIDRTNLFGEIVFENGTYTGLQTGIMWHMGHFESGLAVHHEPSVYYAEDKDARKSWSSLLLRWKPDQSTVVQMSVEPQMQAQHLLLKRTVRFRRRWRYGLTLSGVWNQEEDEHLSGAGWLQSRWQGQTEWQMHRRIHLRGRLEHHRSVTDGTSYHLLMATCYRSKERVTLSAQWQYTLSGNVKGSPEILVFPRSQRSRWTLLMQGPVLPGVEILMRYARAEQTRQAEHKTPLKESDWSMQVSMVW